MFLNYHNRKKKYKNYNWRKVWCQFKNYFVISLQVAVYKLEKKKIGLMNVTLFHTHLLIVFDIFAYLVRYIPR